MHTLYTIIQILTLLLLSPVLLLVALLPKYRGRVLQRLGLKGLPSQLPPHTGKRIWLHALSVGETASARPLVEAIRQSLPDALIIFSSTTQGAQEYRRCMAKEVDLFVAFPFDLSWVVRHFLARLQPHLFILIETDFWPGFLHLLKSCKVPSMLANGRMKEGSFNNYYRFRTFFRPLFSSFDYLSMQTEKDRSFMLKLGVEPSKVVRLGNLKYDIEVSEQRHPAEERQIFGLAPHGLILVAGSTHRGEEKILLQLYLHLLQIEPELILILAPRDPARGKEILEIASKLGLTAHLRSQSSNSPSQILILDTLGELKRIYGLADLAFVGGSLVDQGGHNPLEPAVHGKPVLFGPYMSDFHEISQALQEAGAARVVENQQQLQQTTKQLLADPKVRQQMGEQAAALVQLHQGATKDHISLIRKMLGEQ